MRKNWYEISHISTVSMMIMMVMVLIQYTGRKLEYHKGKPKKLC